jgi:hypothetical protein
MDAFLSVPHVIQIQPPKSTEYCKPSPSRPNNGYIVNVASVMNNDASAGSSRIKSVIGSAGTKIDFSWTWNENKKNESDELTSP